MICFNTLVELLCMTFDDTMRDGKTEVLVNTQADTLALEAKTLRNTLGNVEANALVNTLAETL